MSKTPTWAVELLNKVLLDYNIKDKPEFNWRRSHSKNRQLSSGITTKTKISITACGKKREKKLVLLHEIAHWICPSEEHHGKLFWDTAFDLYRAYGIPIRYALQRERGYRKEAIYAYRRNLNKIREQNHNELKCQNCGREWNYKGDNPYYATCPFCLRKVKVQQDSEANKNVKK